ncbi:MAG TPA: hypothetical protein VGR28_10445 [Candidatus Thermoplasmatota archaeon]|nr:hypothetical protein [Candidatus Thermoplasmatota archaeon]
MALSVLLGLLLAPSFASAQSAVTIHPKESGCPPPATFCWDAANLTGTGGQTVTVELKNDGQAPHSFCIQLPDGEHCTENAQGGTPAGGESEVELALPTQGGIFRYRCGVPGHDTLGMTGNWTVPPGAMQNNNTGNQNNGTTNPPPKSSPTVGLVAIVAGVALLAIAVRRR